MPKFIGNKKVRGTTRVEYNNIKFKSKLECNCYKLLENSGLNFSHESEKISLWEGFKPSITIFAPSKLPKSTSLSKYMEEQTKKFVDITYTPDFIITQGRYKIYMDSKGNPNDVYPYKKKMFIKVLEGRDDEYTYIFMEPHNLRQMAQAIEIIKNYDKES